MCMVNYHANVPKYPFLREMHVMHLTSPDSGAKLRLNLTNNMALSASVTSVHLQLPFAITGALIQNPAVYPLTTLTPTGLP